MAPRPTKKSPGSTTPQPPPRPDLPVQARHPPPPGLPATAPRPTAVVGRVAELMGGKAPYPAVLDERRPGAPLAAHLGQPCPPDPAVEPSYQAIDLWVNVSLNFHPSKGCRPADETKDEGLGRVGADQARFAS